MSSVFLSYSPENRELASLLARAMKDLGIVVLDPADVQPGEDFKSFIKSAIRDSSAMVVVASETMSQWMSYEAGIASILDKPVIVVRPETVDPLLLPEELHSLKTVTTTPSRISHTAKDLAEELA